MKNLLGDEPELDAGKHLKEKQTGGKRKGRRGSGKQRSGLAKDSTRAWFVQHLQESFDTLQKEIANVRQSAADDKEGVLSRLKEQSDLMLRKLLQAKDPLQPLPDIVERPPPPTKAQKEAYLREKQETASRKRPPQGTPLNNDPKRHDTRNTPSYKAAALRGNLAEKTNLPFLLYVHRGQTEREALLEGDMMQIRTTLDERYLKLIGQGTPNLPRLCVADSWQAQGKGVIGCENLETREWYCSQIRTLDFEGARFRAWRKGEDDHWKSVTVRVRDSMLNFSLDQLMEFAKFQNQMDFGKDDYQLQRSSEAEDGSHIFTVGVTPKLLWMLHDVRGDVKVASTTLHFQFKGSMPPRPTNVPNDPPNPEA
jgi:hypothetical protein